MHSQVPSADLLATDRITEGRHAVGVEWSHRVADAHRADPKLLPVAPGYFLDRHAFARLRHPLHITANPAPGFDPHKWQDRTKLLELFCVPARTLGGWRPEADQPTGVGGFYQQLRSWWKAFGTRIGLPREVSDLMDAAASTWREVFDQSIFYPRGPAIPGATFHDLISDEDRQVIRNHYGGQAPVDFYCFIQQVHEAVHVVQTGEPLLNEVVQASLWVEFLDRNPALWTFQRNSQNGRSAVRELALVRRLPDLWERAIDAELDAAALTDNIGAPGTYFVLCLWANRFDAKLLRYASYLSGVAQAFALSGSDEQVRYLASRLLRARTAQRLQRLGVPRI